ARVASAAFAFALESTALFFAHRRRRSAGLDTSGLSHPQVLHGNHTVDAARPAIHLWDGHDGRHASEGSWPPPTARGPAWSEEFWSDVYRRLKESNGARTSDRAVRLEKSLWQASRRRGTNKTRRKYFDF